VTYTGVQFFRGHGVGVKCDCVGSVAVGGPSWVVLLAAVLCILILMLPLSTDYIVTNDDTGTATTTTTTTHTATTTTTGSSSLAVYSYFVVSVHQKLIAAYILGTCLSVCLSVFRLQCYGHVLRKEDDDWVKKCMECEMEGARPRGRPKKTWREIVEKDCQVRGLNREDAMDHSGWMKQIRDD